jgi:hypothetical protein
MNSRKTAMGSVFIWNPLHDFGTNRVKGCAKVYGLTLFLHVSSIRGNAIFTGKENSQSMDWVKPSERRVLGETAFWQKVEPATERPSSQIGKQLSNKETT